MMRDHPTSTTDHRVVSIRGGRPVFRPAQGNANTPAPVGNLDEFESERGADDYRHRMIANAAAFVFVVLLVLAGVWIANSLATMRKNQDCVLSGKRGCTPVEASVNAR